MSEFNIHNIRFYDFHPESIQCMAYNDYNKLLALSRADASIEIWNCEMKPFKQKTVIGSPNTSIESLVWCNERLFSSGINSFVLEYHPKSLSVINKVSVTGGPTWCLALSPDQKILAAGTEEGFITLFNIVPDGLDYIKTIQHQNLRILSLGWHPDCVHLASGSINYINFMSIHDDLKNLQFPVAKVKNSEDTIVWCISVLEDSTIITGDSRGKTCFWDGNFGTLLSSIQSHQADVLAMQVRGSESVFVAGIDPVIVEVRLVDTGSRQGRSKAWVKSFHRRIHTHDVRALALTKEGKLFSGGVDTYLAMSYYPPKTAIKYPPTPPRGYISSAKEAPLVALGFKDKVEIWRLGRGHFEPDSDDSRYLTMDEDRLKLVEIQLKKNDILQAVAISPNGTRVAIVTVAGTPKIYEISHNSDISATLRKLTFRIGPELMLKSSSVTFASEDTLVSCSVDVNIVQVFCIEDNEFSLKKNIKGSDEEIAERCFCSDTGNLLAVLESNNLYSIYKLNPIDKISKISATFPKSKKPVTALCLDHQSVLLSTSDMSLCEYDIKTGLFTAWGRDMFQNPCPEISKSNSVILNISLDSNDRIFLHNIAHIYSIQKLQEQTTKMPVSDFHRNKIRKVDSTVNDKMTQISTEKMDSESNDSGSCMVKTYGCGGRKMTSVARSNHVMFFTYLRNKELISVEKNPIWLLDSLPPALKVKKFGAS